MFFRITLFDARLEDDSSSFYASYIKSLNHDTTNCEAQANKYAAEILMPVRLINHALEQGLSSIADLADHFQVSKSSMSIRMGVPYDN